MPIAKKPTPSPTPTLKVRTPAISPAEKMQADALKKLMAEREKYAKTHKGNWPTDPELDRFRKTGR